MRASVDVQIAIFLAAVLTVSCTAKKLEEGPSQFTTQLLFKSDVRTLIKTSAGLIQGYVDPVYTNLIHFYNIPYAKPPIGSLRFAPPSPLPLLPISPYPATNRTIQQCVQNQGGLIGLEDCLVLSITIPNTPLSSTGVGWPVFVSICGGGFVNCYKNDPSAWLNTTGDYIYIDVTYRLGLFGFLSLPELSAEKNNTYSYSGNQGLQDQTLAFQWIYDHISSFGGDINRITISGESAGSISICYHLIMPNSIGRFTAAILESGACETPFPIGATTLERAEKVHQEMIIPRLPSECMNIPSSKLLTCIRSLSTEVLYNIWQSIPLIPYVPFISIFIPIIDGVIVPNTPSATIVQGGNYARVPIIAGTNTGETTLWLLNQGPNYNYTYSVDELNAQINFDANNNYYYNQSIINFYNITEYYTHYHINYFPFIYVNATSSRTFHCPNRRLLQWMSTDKTNTAPIYQYNWGFVAASDSFAWTKLARHGNELQYIYQRGLGGISDEDIVSAMIRNYIHRFITHHNVNKNDTEIDIFYQQIYKDFTLPVWNIFMSSSTDDNTTTDQGLFVLSDAPYMKMWSNMYRDQCDDLWDAVFAVPTITPRITQCRHDECSVDASHHINVCIDNFNGTYYCQCGDGWKPVNNDTACVTSMTDRRVTFADISGDHNVNDTQSKQAINNLWYALPTLAFLFGCLLAMLTRSSWLTTERGLTTKRFDQLRAPLQL